MADSTFYLGRIYDPKTSTLTSKPLEYDSADLTTHAVVTGMTGSGKTGLCIAMLEEAALQGVPAIIIDPKGDLTNLLLHFPELLPSDFQPWIDPEVVRRAGTTPEKAAEEAADAWEKGIKEWGMDQARIMDLKNAVDFAVYTPGSDSGIPVSVLSSLAAPDLDWEENREVLRERISSTVTALLGLVGMNDLDPIRSREHILLSNIFEEHWSNKQDISLEELILQIQTPPFDKLGAFPVDTFFPQKDRMELAMIVNNILAAPAFEAWREGQSLDIQSLLFTSQGSPRHSIFYLAHLSDGERMFFTTLLLSAVETWMRTQKGSTSLRALLYMDEIYGYLPPTANPPSKQPLLRMLKQARAFGLGLLLATQNPVDMDYKALSNTGTWFIGKLQTERDKNRLLDGLESLAGGISRAQMDKLISSLGKRVFVMNNVNEKAPMLFQTRWVMNFLAGPMTRQQIPDLNALVGAKSAPQYKGKSVSKPVTDSLPKQKPPLDQVQPVVVPVAETRNAQPTTRNSTNGTSTKPPVPNGVREYYLPQNYSLSEAYKNSNRSMPFNATIQSILYKPALLASARIRFLDRKYGVDVDQSKTVLINQPEKNGLIRWENFVTNKFFDNLETIPSQDGKYESIDSPLSDAKRMNALQKDFSDWIYREFTVKARVNRALKVFVGPDVSQAEFMTMCSESARNAADAQIVKETKSIDKQLKTLNDRLAREQRELRQDEEELQSRKVEELGTHAENVLGLFTGSRSTRKLSSSLSKRRLTENAKADVEESIDSIAQYQRQIKELEIQREEIKKTISEYWSGLVNEKEEVNISPKKTDIFVEIFGVAWLPYYVVANNEEPLPAFGSE